VGRWGSGGGPMPQPHSAGAACSGDRKEAGAGISAGGERCQLHGILTSVGLLLVGLFRFLLD
jgi:hypothetical protein